METVTIKVLENPAVPGLKMKYVDAVEYVEVGTSTDGKFITGFDENALEVLQIEDPAERKAKQEQIKKERKELEILLNVDLNPNSSFWTDFNYTLQEGQVLSPLNPQHRLLEIFLVANARVAPSIDAIDNDEKFYECVYYFHRQKEQEEADSKKALDYDKVVGTLSSIFDKNPAKIKKLEAYIYGYNTDSTRSAEQSYLKLRGSIDPEKVKSPTERKDNLNRLKEVLGKKQEEIELKVLIDKAVKLRVITQKGRVYRYEDEVVGHSFEEVLVHFGKAENSSDVNALQKSLQKK